LDDTERCRAEEFLFEGLLPAILENELGPLPQGYAHLAAVLEFERHFQFEGWGALANYDALEKKAIVDGYRFLGLLSEAQALRASSKKRADENAGIESFDARLRHIMGFVRAYPEHFRAEL
jgi:hypothetical protein